MDVQRIIGLLKVIQMQEVVYVCKKKGMAEKKSADISKSLPVFPSQNNLEVSELCFLVICIIHVDGWICFPTLGSFSICRLQKETVSSAAQATKRRLSKGRNGLSSPDPSIVLMIGSR